MNKYKAKSCLFWTLGLLAILFAAKCIIDFFNN